MNHPIVIFSYLLESLLEKNKFNLKKSYNRYNIWLYKETN